MITGDFVNGLHIMLGKNSDMDNGSPKVTETSENTFFLNWESGDIFVFSEGEWAEADSAVAGIVAALLNKAALPAVTATDNGKVLKVVDGVWAPGTGGGGGDVDVDTQLNADSENPVQNKAIYAAFAQAAQALGLKQDAAIVEPVTGTTPSITVENNHIYKCGEVSSVTVSIPALTDADSVEFTVIFESGSTAAELTMDNAITMPDGFTVESNKRYEINVMGGYAVAASWAVSAS